MRKLLVLLVLLIALPVSAQLSFNVEGFHEENGKFYLVLPGEAAAIEMQRLFFGNEEPIGFARDGQYYMEIPAEALEAMAGTQDDDHGTISSSIPGYYYDGDFPEGGGFICHQESEGYLVAIPSGWVNDRDAAAEMGLCAILVPEGEDFLSASAIIYPVTDMKKGSKLADSAKKQAETSRDLIAQSLGKAPILRDGGTVKGTYTTAALWYFDEGPIPNNWEAAAYAVSDKSIFTLVISAMVKEGRDKNMAKFLEAAKSIKLVEVKKK